MFYPLNCIPYETKDLWKYVDKKKSCKLKKNFIDKREDFFSQGNPNPIPIIT